MTKKTIEERQKEFLAKQKEMLARQRQQQKLTLKRQSQRHRRFLRKIRTGETGLRYSRWGMRSGYVLAGAGLALALIYPLSGLGLLAAGTTSVLTNRLFIRRLEEKQAADKKEGNA